MSIRTILSISSLGVVIGGVGIGLLSQGDSNKNSTSNSLDPSGVESVLLDTPCLNEPIIPIKMFCAIKDNGDGTWKPDLYYYDCVDNSNIVTCLFKKNKIKEEIKENCPKCIDKCKSIVGEQYDSDLRKYKDQQKACPVGTIQQGSYCICRKDKNEPHVSGEVESVEDLPAQDRIRKVICCNSGKVTNKYEEPDIGNVPANCIVYAKPLINVGFENQETDLTRKVKKSCNGGTDTDPLDTPCIITPKSWGNCPDCLCLPGGCGLVCNN